MVSQHRAIRAAPVARVRRALRLPDGMSFTLVVMSAPPEPCAVDGPREIPCSSAAIIIKSRSAPTEGAPPSVRDTTDTRPSMTGRSPKCPGVVEQQRRIEPHPVVAGSLVCPEADEATVMARTAGEVRPQIDARAGTDEDLGSVTANDPLQPAGSGHRLRPWDPPVLGDDPETSAAALGRVNGPAAPQVGQ